MNKEEKQAKVEDLKKKMSELNAQIKDTADTLTIIGLEAEDVLNKKMDEAKCNLAAAKESYHILSEQGKGKVSSELIKAQMNFEVAKENLKKQKVEHDKEKLSNYIDDVTEYAEQCLALSVLAADEAKVAFLEAEQAEREYDQKFGDNK